MCNFSSIWQGLKFFLCSSNKFFLLHILNHSKEKGELFEVIMDRYMYLEEEKLIKKERFESFLNKQHLFLSAIAPFPTMLSSGSLLKGA